MFKILLSPHFQPHGVGKKSSKAKSNSPEKLGIVLGRQTQLLSQAVGYLLPSNPGVQLCLEVKSLENA